MKQKVGNRGSAQDTAALDRVLPQKKVLDCSRQRQRHDGEKETDDADGRSGRTNKGRRKRVSGQTRGSVARAGGAERAGQPSPRSSRERERPTRRETGGEGGKKKKRKSNAPSFDTFTPVQGFSCTPFIAPSPFVTVISFLFFLFSLSLSRLCVRASASSVAFSLSLSQKGGLKPGLPCVRFLFSSYGSLSLFRESRTRVYYSARRFFFVRALRSPRSGADSWREYISRLGVP